MGADIDNNNSVIVNSVKSDVDATGSGSVLADEARRILSVSVGLEKF